jgi:hypothetical protein
MPGKLGSLFPGIAFVIHLISEICSPLKVILFGYMSQSVDSLYPAYTPVIPNAKT